jgi:uncharacterized Zn finger protein
VWADFAQHPSLPLYQTLKAQAEKVGQWADWRSRAIQQVEQATHQSRRQSSDRGAFQNSMNDSLLVEIFLWEGDRDQAWEAAQVGKCLPKQWLRLADLRAADHPEDALSVYLPRIEPLIQQTNHDAYLRAVDLLIKAQTLMKRLNREAEFEALRSRLTTEYKRKRNFIKLLIDRGLA